MVLLFLFFLIFWKNKKDIEIEIFEMMKELIFFFCFGPPTVSMGESGRILLYLFY